MYRQTTRLLCTAALVVAAGAGTACDDNDITGVANGTAGDPNRVFNQIERLGNPLVSEVTIAKRDHGFYNVGTPSTDRANFKGKVVSFIRTVAGRSDATANALADALLPDMLVVQTDKAANTAGWLSYVLNPNAYGGRKLADDVVDIGLMAIFGSLVDPNNVTPGLTSDNVGNFGGGPAPTGAFPYLATPNQ